MRLRLLAAPALLRVCLVLFVCVPLAAKSAPPLTREDVLWLDRVTYGINATTVAEYRRVGRAAFLRAQLAPRDTALPPPIAQLVDALPVSHAQGNLATSLHSLGEGLQAFAAAMGPDWKDTVVVVVSEFGRTFRENGNRGTDHGHASAYWVMGGGISGGRIVGEQQRIAHDTLFQDRDLPVLNDHRAVLGGLFQRMWGLSDAQLERVFPNAAPRDFKLI
jgi:hypothetical protein